MSTLKANNVQIGQSSTAAQNFTLAVPASPDGTIKLARGNSGATTADIINIDASGDIYSSWCGAKHFGNISNLDSWELPSSETECPFDFCNNISDIAITKVA